MKKSKTHRGFAIVEFKDYYKQECSLQKSSLVEPDCIWLGVDNTGELISGANGKKKCDGNRMHLTRLQVLELLPYLIGFIKKGEIIKSRDWTISKTLSKKQFIKSIS